MAFTAIWQYRLTFARIKFRGASWSLPAIKNGTPHYLRFSLSLNTFPFHSPLILPVLQWRLQFATKPLSLIKPQHFATSMKYYSQVPLFQSGSKCTRVQCDAIMDIYGGHLLRYERGMHKMKPHDAQVRLLEADLIKAARHPAVEPRPFRSHASCLMSGLVSGIWGGTYCST